jgi:hypothetical protein
LRPEVEVDVLPEVEAWVQLEVMTKCARREGVINQFREESKGSQVGRSGGW